MRTLYEAANGRRPATNPPCAMAVQVSTSDTDGDGFEDLRNNYVHGRHHRPLNGSVGIG